MIYKRILLRLLCVWLSLHVTAGTLAGCDFVDRSTTKNAGAELVVPHSAEHVHCKENVNADGIAQEVVKTNSLDFSVTDFPSTGSPSTSSPSIDSPSTSDCDSCKLHCSTVTLLNGIDEPITLNNFKEKFTPSTTPTDDSIYLDLPHRPPLSRS